MTYFLFRFDQSKEDRVRRRAARFNIEVIAPRVTTWRKGKRGTKPKPVQVPAFHAYCILGFEHDQLNLALTGLHHSVRPMLVPFDGHEWTLARVPDEEVERIKDCRLFTSRSAPPPVVKDPEFKKEEVLRILGGAASGLRGTVLAANPEKREAELEMNGWAAKLTVSYDILERAA